MGTMIPAKYLQLWVKDDFDVPRTYYKNIRSTYRKFIKKPLMGLGIRVVSFPSLTPLLFNTFKGMKCESVREYRDFLHDSSQEILMHLKGKEDLLTDSEKKAHNEAMAHEELSLT
jgi:hypothetical protein